MSDKIRDIQKLNNSNNKLFL